MKIITEDITLAAYLLCLGHALQGVKLVTPYKKLARFEFDAIEPTVVRSFHEDQASVEPKLYAKKLKFLTHLGRNVPQTLPAPDEPSQ